MNSTSTVPFVHGTIAKTAIVLVNLGTPDTPEPAAVARYLKQFLSDPRVVEIPRLLWLNLLKIIVPLRAKKSAAKYEMVWLKEGSPLQVWTATQTKLLRGLLGGRGSVLLVDYAMRYGNPSIASVLDRVLDAGATRILVLPLYPQYSATTSGSTIDEIGRWTQTVRNVPEMRFVKHYHDHPAYIAALKARVTTFWEKEGRAFFSRDPDAMKKYRLVLSFHGLPQRNLSLGDPYHCECLKTGRLLAESLGMSSEVVVTFQSRFGRAQWLEPYTAATLVQMAKDGVESVDIFCPGFPADCLETLEEIAIEARQLFLDAGGKTFRFISCLNDSSAWISALGQIAFDQMVGWPLEAGPEVEESAAASRERALATGAAR